MSTKLWRAKNKDYIRAYQRLWIAKNKEHVLEYQNAYHKRYSKYKRRIIRKLLGGKCNFCKSGVNIDIHHLTYNPDRKQKHQIYWCDIHNLDIILLCRRCHKKEHPNFFTYRSKLSLKESSIKEVLSNGG